MLLLWKPYTSVKKLRSRKYLLPPVYVVRGKVMFILGNVCLSIGGTYPAWDALTLDGGAYFGRRILTLNLGVPTTRDERYLP